LSDLPPFELGYARTELRRRLVEAVLAGKKTATAGLADVDEQFARDEGEGFESVEDWRVVHERFFERPIQPDTLIEAVRFRLVEDG
jgi:uncharacterized protein YhfF